MIIPKKEILYAPMVGTLGGGSARGFGRGKGRFNFAGLTFRFENPEGYSESGHNGFSFTDFANRSNSQQPDVWRGMKSITSMIDSGYVEFVAPITGTYRFTVAGARGGGLTDFGNQDNSADHQGGGHGRILVVDMPLTEGNTYTVLPGHRGGTYSGDQCGGGGGGSFLFSGSRGTSLTTLIAAGGGGGGGRDSYNSNASDLARQHGQLAASNGAGGGYGPGTNGYGGTSGSSSSNGCSGSGVFGRGVGDSSVQSESIINSNGNGSTGVYGSSSNYGGFGGGAAGWGAAGGGGGYSGGGAKVDSGAGARSGAGGGGSWYAGYASPPVGTLVSHTGLNYNNAYNNNGYVTMEFPS
jgi:hypothetical protein